MDELFERIYSCEDCLEDVYEGLPSNPLKDYYALFIAAMAQNNYIKLSPQLAADLYVDIMNISLLDTDKALKKINHYLVDKAITELEVEFNNGEKQSRKRKKRNGGSSELSA